MSGRFKRVEEPKIEEHFDYAEEVRKQIDRCLQVFSDTDGTMLNEIKLENTILALENMIPETDRDEQLEEEIEKAKVIHWVDNPRINCGVRVGPKKYKDEICTPEEAERYHRPIEMIFQNQEAVNVIQPHPYFRACFNMFVRLKVVVRRSARAG